MNNTLDKRLQMYIINKAISNMPFGRVWDSSAKNLEDALQKRGIKLPVKLYHEYKLPGGLGPDEFMTKLIKENFSSEFYSWFAKDVLKDKSLTMSDKAKIFSYVWKTRGKYKDLLKQYETEIRALNPELQNVKVDNSRSLVYGAMFGFAPVEIAYFADTANRNLAKEKDVSKILKNYGIDLTYVLAPKTADMILSVLQQNVQNNSKDR